MAFEVRNVYWTQATSFENYFKFQRKASSIFSQVSWPQVHAFGYDEYYYREEVLIMTFTNKFQSFLNLIFFNLF